MQNNNLAVFGLGILTLLIIPVAAHGQSDSKTQYVRMCSLCHGMDGKAQTSMGKSLKAADLTSPAVQSKSDAEIRNQIANGKGKMSAYEGILGKQGVDNMVKYVRSLAPPKK
ncbi:MAG TPA: cytochrome c [Terriglobales bacterium]